MTHFDQLLTPSAIKQRSAAHLLRICVICETKLDEIVFASRDEELSYLLSAVCPSCGTFLREMPESCCEGCAST